MNGRLVIRDVFGVAHEILDTPHAKFMELRENLRSNEPILIASQHPHKILNPRHIVVIEWS